MKTLLLLMMLLPTAIVHTQKGKNDKVTFFVYDENWQGCKIENAKYLGCFEKLSDTAYQWKYYNFAGPLLSVETYKDKETTIPHGEFVFYGADGKMDSSGYTANGVKIDWWYHYTDSFTVFQKDRYEKGRLVEKKDIETMIKEKEEEDKKRDSITKHIEIEASFNGGEKAWVKYIQKNIDFPERARSLKKDGSLLVQFIVGKDGVVGDVRIIRSIEYSIDEEALRLIRNAPDWNPASRDGKTVKAYRRQPLTFRLPQ